MKEDGANKQRRVRKGQEWLRQGQTPSHLQPYSVAVRLIAAPLAAPLERDGVKDIDSRRRVYAPDPRAAIDL